MSRDQHYASPNLPTPCWPHSPLLADRAFAVNIRPLEGPCRGASATGGKNDQEIQSHCGSDGRPFQRARSLAAVGRSLRGRPRKPGLPGDAHRRRGATSPLRLPELRPDACFNALHGRWGEDGCVQGLLELLAIPYTHSGVLASSMAMNKHYAKMVFREAGVPVAESVVASRDGGGQAPRHRAALRDQAAGRRIELRRVHRAAKTSPIRPRSSTVPTGRWAKF